MLALSRWRFWGILTACLMGILFSVPNVLSDQHRALMPSWLQKTINLGLELRGGSHLQLEVDLKAVSKEYLNTLVDDVRSHLRKENIGYLGLSVDSRGQVPALNFHLRSLKDFERTRTLILSLDSSLSVSLEKETVKVFLAEEIMQKRNLSLIEQSIEVIRRRIDEMGTKEPIIQRQGDSRIIVQTPGVENPQEMKALIGKTAKMTFHLVAPNIQPVVLPEGQPLKEKPPSGVEYLPEERQKGVIVYLPVYKNVALSGEHLSDAQVTMDQNGLPAVSLKFNSIGSKKFADMSAKNIKKQFAVVLDKKVITAPVFQSIIPDGNGQISGHFTIKDATELALLLRAGALPAPLKILEERTVGPSLGADSIRDGQFATIIAFIFVSVFMLLTYRLFGLFADIALLFNLIFLFAGLSLLQATLTLPGIAGIALTIGMAVDANVLIYERIKEELRLGAKPVIAIDAGYKRAVTTILDSNLTTLLGAAVLFEFGTGPIRGFAVTLALGILISLFTALSLTRLIIASWLKKRRVTTLPI